MKIAIDISQIIYGTGVSTYTKNLIENLVRLYPKDEFYLFGGSLRRMADLKNLTKRLKSKKCFYPFPPSFLDLIWNSFHVLPIEKLVGKVDVVHTSDWAEPPSKLPKVTTVHDLIPFVYPQSTTNNIRSAHRKRLAWVCRESKYIITVSKSTRDDLLNLFKVNENRVRVIPEGVDLFFKPQPPFLIDVIKKKYHIPGPFLFTLSTVEPRKNLSKTIAAFEIVRQKHKGLSLVVGGKMGWGTAPDPSSGVIYTNYVPEADLPALFSGSLAFVLPSLYEGFGLPHLEAMACGIPVVGSNVSSMPEVIGTAGVLVDPNNADNIAEGIIKAIRERERLVPKGLQRAKLFNWEETAKLTHEVYELATQKS